MAHFYLEFEKSLKPLDEMINSLESKSQNLSKMKFNHYWTKIRETSLMDSIFSNLTRWERVQLARHPKRPFSLDYIKHFSKRFY